MGFGFVPHRSLLGGVCLVSICSAVGCGRAASGANGDPNGGKEEAGGEDADGLGEDGPSVELGEGPWLGSFETDLDGDEQLWLLPTSVEPVSVLDPPMPALAVASRSTLGYSDEGGQISETVFDVAHERLLVTSIMSRCLHQDGRRASSAWMHRRGSSRTRTG
jgi:hypothetical protein